jgi:hypothetical protein
MFSNLVSVKQLPGSYSIYTDKLKMFVCTFRMCVFPTKFSIQCTFSIVQMREGHCSIKLDAIVLVI